MATEEHVNEALRLFHVSTLDAARSGITSNMIVTPEMRAEIQVTHHRTFLISINYSCLFSRTLFDALCLAYMNSPR